MIAFSHIEELNKVIRSQLVLQSRIDGEKVLNSLSIHGEDLDKLFEEQIYVSIDRADVMILFELRSRKNDADMSQTEDDETISSYRSFEVYVVMYGNDSTDYASKIISRFRTERVREQLRYAGVYLEEVTDFETINEYKNETMWIRNDFSINISCRFSIEQVEQDERFNLISKNIITI